MSLQYIRSTYNVPAHRGTRVTYTGNPSGPRTGTIYGAENQYIRVRFDGQTKTTLLHPTWEIKYSE